MKSNIFRFRKALSTWSFTKKTVVRYFGNLNPFLGGKKKEEEKTRALKNDRTQPLSVCLSLSDLNALCVRWVYFAVIVTRVVKVDLPLPNPILPHRGSRFRVDTITGDHS